MEHQRIQLIKDGNEHALYYENNEKRLEKNISSDQFKRIFENIQPNFSFSLPDKLIQDFVKDGSVLPSFKNSPQFTKEDFNDIIDPIKEDLNYITKIRERKQKKIKKYIKNRTKRKYKKNAEDKKDDLISKVLKKKVKKNHKKTNKK